MISYVCYKRCSVLGLYVQDFVVLAGEHFDSSIQLAGLVCCRWLPPGSWVPPGWLAPRFLGLGMG